MLRVSFLPHMEVASHVFEIMDFSYVALGVTIPQRRLHDGNREGSG